jgi:hypothetical protein
MAATPVQNVGPTTGSQQLDPIAEAGQWKEGLRASFDSARVDGAIKPNLVAQAAYQSMIAPTASGVPLRDLPPDVAQQILDARNEAMTEFMEGWAENIRKNAKLDKEAAKRAQVTARMLKSAQNAALTRAKAFVSGRSPAAPSQNSGNRPVPATPNPRARMAVNGAPTLAAGGVAGAFSAPGSGQAGVGTARKNRFG